MKRMFCKCYFSKYRIAVLLSILSIPNMLMSSAAYSGTLIEVGDINEFLHSSSNSTLESWFKNKIEEEINEEGIRSTVGGLIYTENFTDNKTSCSRERHYSSIDVSLTLYNPTSLSIEFSGLNEPIVSNLHIDGELAAKGYYRARPHIDYGILGCDGVGEANINIDTEIRMIADATATIDTNLEFTSENSSISGYPIISVDPTGVVEVAVKSWRLDNNTVIDVDSEIFSTIGGFLSGISGFIGGQILDWAVARKAEDKAQEVIDNFYNVKLRNEMLALSTDGLSIDITDDLGGYQEYILPSEQEIRDQLGREILKHNDTISMLCGEFNRDPVNALVAALTNDEFFRSNYLSSEQACGASILVAVNSMML